MIAVNIGCKSVRRRSLELLILLTAIVLQGCSFTGTTHDARVDAFERDMRTVEIGPTNFLHMSALDVVDALHKPGNAALARSGCEFSFSLICRYDQQKEMQKRDWYIPRMPILDAYEYVCRACGALIKYEDGLLIISFIEGAEDVLGRSPKEEEAGKKPSEEECKRRDELMRTLEIGPADFSDMSIFDAIGELHELGDDALKKAGWNPGLEIACGGYGRYEEVTKSDWRIPRSPILKACEHLCRSCGAAMEYTNGVVLIYFNNADSASGDSIDGGENDSDNEEQIE